MLNIKVNNINGKYFVRFIIAFLKFTFISSIKIKFTTAKLANQILLGIKNIKVTYARNTKNVIALDNGLEIIFINDSGNFLKKCEYKGQLKDLKLFNEGNRAVLIFRNVADFIKVGGI